MIRIGVVDDHPIFREGVILTLQGQPDMEVVASGASADDAIRISREMKPDLIVLDMNMPGDGITAVEAISQGQNSVSTLMLTVEADEEKACEAIQKGAKGYVLKGIGGAELVRAVRAVHQGECYVMPTLAAHLLGHLGRTAAAKTAKPEILSGMSQREEEILAFIAQGLSNKAIANELCLSDKTIKHYVSGLLQKLQVRSRVEAAIIATRLMAETQDGHRRPTRDRAPEPYQVRGRQIPSPSLSAQFMAA
jgi:DNA-binding NarL/FixJ family response regulator